MQVEETHRQSQEQLRQMAEVHQKQMEALQSAHNQQFASVLRYLENLGHAVAPQVQLPPLP
jgi:two-component sensor histidine kinase